MQYVKLVNSPHNSNNILFNEEFYYFSDFPLHLSEFAERDIIYIADVILCGSKKNICDTLRGDIRLKNITKLSLLKNWKNVDFQMRAVAKNGNCIRYIRKPTIEVMRLSIKQSEGESIKYIKHIPEEIQLMAIDFYYRLIEYILNPTEEAQIKAITKCGTALKYIKHPTEKVKMLAVKENTNALAYIKYPSLEIQLEAIRQDPDAIDLIHHCYFRKTAIEAVKIKASVIKYLPITDARIKLLAIKQRPDLLTHRYCRI